VWLLGGRISSELALLTSSGPDSLATTLRDLLGADSIAIGGQQITVAEIARQIQARAASLIATSYRFTHLKTSAPGSASCHDSAEMWKRPPRGARLGR